KHRDFSQPGSLVPFVARINDIRHRHPAFADLGNVAIHHSNNDQILCWSKVDRAADDVMLMVVNLDPHNTHEDTLGLDLPALGFDCLWLLPFYSSPLRDGGYDIAEFFTILPEYGKLGDAVRLMEEAHRRGIRIITDLVVNHTSDQHPWFQESRQSRDNPRADWYVWSDSDQGYADARIIFTDTERSNWAWDPDRQQYYWHRFFSHQPDLNYDNPEVQEALMGIVRFWLNLGLDGFRLDAVPYLFEREGTNCENLPETHAFLKRVRKEVDAAFPRRVLLAEANQWPADVVAYFGDSDECHMCFNFPLMPRLFMALRRS